MTPGYREAAVHPALNQLVVCTWVDTRTERSPVLPDACIDIVWDGVSLTVAGPDTGPMLVAERATFVGIRFRPGVAPGFLGVPASELRDRSVDLAELWGGLGAELAERLADDPSTASRTLEQAVLARLDEVRPADAVVLQLIAELGRGCPLHACIRRLGVNERTLHRRCVSALGYGPKTLERILRFRRALTLTWSGSAALADAAYEAGYADQAHLSREFRRLAGASPTELLAGPHMAMISNGVA